MAPWIPCRNILIPLLISAGRRCTMGGRMSLCWTGMWSGSVSRSSGKSMPRKKSCIRFGTWKIEQASTNSFKLPSRIDNGAGSVLLPLMNWAVCPCTVGVAFFSLCCETAPAASWSDGAGYRSAEVLPGTGGKVGFTLMDPRETGVGFTNVLRGDAYSTNAVAHNGSGVAIGDVDGDGRPDIYLCSLQGPNRLYRNRGQWHFEEMAIG